MQFFDFISSYVVLRSFSEVTNTLQSRDIQRKAHREVFGTADLLPHIPVKPTANNYGHLISRSRQ